MPLLSIVIPTRNRPDHLQHAVASVADQLSDELELIVSDNSDEAIAQQNQANVQALAPGNARYIRPPESQAMVEHWNWAVSQATGAYVTILTDRMVFKRGALAALNDVLRTHRPLLLAYPHDTFSDKVPPFTYSRRPYTGDVLTVSGQAVLKAARRGDMSRLWPRFLNSACAASVLQEMKDTYGEIFTGLAPDYSFCFQSIDYLEEYMMWDNPLLISGGEDVSNGTNFVANTDSNVRKDFIALNQKYLTENARRIMDDALIPWTCPVPYNAEMLEYLLAKENQISGMFKDIDKQQFYLIAYQRLIKMSLQGKDVGQGLEALRTFQKKHGLKKWIRTNHRYRIIAKILKQTLKRYLPQKNKHKEALVFENIAQAREYAEQHPLARLPSGSREHIQKKLFGRDVSASRSKL